MTTSRTNQNNSVFASFINSNPLNSKVQQQHIKPATAETNKADNFEKTTAPKPQIVEPAPLIIKKTKIPINKERIKSFAYSLAVCVCAGLILSKIGNISKLKNPKGKIKAHLSNIWEDLSRAKSIDEMALPKSLRETLDGVIKCITDPKAVTDGGGESIKTILLYGPPGTGKTTFVKALAKHFLDSEFASLDVTNLGSKYVGETEKNIQAAVNEICKRAQENPNKKFFVFIDEIDSVIMVDDSSTKKHSNDVLNEFKRCFTERLGKHDNIITVGATNVPINPETGKTFDGKRLDKPMLDRFQRKIYVGLPTSEQIRETFLRHYQGKTRVCDELKDANSQKIKDLCDILSDEKHEVSFRTLTSIFNDAATQGDMKDKVSIQNIFDVILAKKEELHFSVEELKNLAQKLGVTFDASKVKDVEIKRTETPLETQEFQRTFFDLFKKLGMAE